MVEYLGRDSPDLSEVIFQQGGEGVELLLQHAVVRRSSCRVTPAAAAAAEEDTDSCAADKKSVPNKVTTQNITAVQPFRSL